MVLKKRKKLIQTSINDYSGYMSKQIGLDLDSYDILLKLKKKLIKKYNRFISFSDVVRELNYKYIEIK